MKIYINGRKLIFRVMLPEETITVNSYHCWMGSSHKPYSEYSEQELRNFGWLHTRCAGELVGSHPERIYIEVSE